MIVLSAAEEGPPSLFFLSMVFLMAEGKKILDLFLAITMQFHITFLPLHGPFYHNVLHSYPPSKDRTLWDLGPEERALDAMMHAVAVKALQHRRRIAQ